MAAQKPVLRAVSGDVPAFSTSPDVAVAARTGDHRSLLVAMRDRIAETVADPDCAARDLASLTKRLGDIVREIEAIDERGRGDAGVRLRELEAALRVIDPAHPLLVEVVNDRFDPAAV